SAADLYASSAALVYPSRYEGFGLPILEAMQYGCPVITTRGGSSPEVAGDAAEYVDPDDPDGLAQAILKVVGDSHHRQQMVDLGRERARHYSWKTCAALTLAAYQMVQT